MRPDSPAKGLKHGFPTTSTQCLVVGHDIFIIDARAVRTEEQLGVTKSYYLVTCRIKDKGHTFNVSELLESIETAYAFGGSM